MGDDLDYEVRRPAHCGLHHSPGRRPWAVSLPSLDVIWPLLSSPSLCDFSAMMVLLGAVN